MVSDSTEALSEKSLNWNTDGWQNIKPELAGQDIDLWLLDVGQVKKYSAEARLKFFSHTELKRAEKIGAQEKKNLYLGGRLGLRKILGLYTDRKMQQLRFSYGKRGKPFLLGQENNMAPITFNYTLSKEFAFYAFSRGRELGVDIECFPREVNSALLAASKLSATEYQCWQRLTKKNDSMLACWTRKEAYGKLLGVGIRYFMNQADLFQNLEYDCWLSQVAGLFEHTHALENKLLLGWQVGLPIAGAATLMVETDFPLTHINELDRHYVADRFNLSGYRLVV